MPGVLVLYASTHGHTAKLAARLAEAIEGEDLAPDVHDVRSDPGLSPSDYDGVVAGASVHGGSHQREIVDWARHHHVTLNSLPSAFFSVCLTAADDTDEAQQATRDYIDDFLDDTGWTPDRTASFAGALQYLEYDFVTRLVMRLLMRRGEHPTDISQDYDYTDWDAVERFGHECGDLVRAA